MSDAPLANLKVLDLSRVLAGPFAGRMLADLGADVIKVEPPDLDVTRSWGRRYGGISGYFHQQNAGKKNICINLKSEAGRKLLLKLASHSDVLLENFRPGVMNKLGLGWEQLKAVNPALVMVSISGFGQDGPESGRAAYAPIIHAETGSIFRQAQKGGGEPVEMCMSFADTNAGLHGLVGMLAALYQRQFTGRGQHLDISMVDAMLATDDQTHYHLDDAVVMNNASEVWEATGGPVMIAGDFRYIWKTATTRMGLEDPTPEDASLEEKIEIRRAAFRDYLRGFETRDELIKALNKGNLAWGSVFDTGDYLDRSPTIKHRQSIQQVDNREGGTRPTYQSPYRFSDATTGVKGGAPYPGEHNQEILADWLGMNVEEVSRLEAEGVLFRDVPTG